MICSSGSCRFDAIQWKKPNNGQVHQSTTAQYHENKSAGAKILFAIPSMVLGGSERVMLNLLNHLDTEWFEPHVAVLERGGMWLENTLPHVHVHELGVWRARRAMLALAKLCWKLRPQAVLSTSAHLNAALITSRPLLPKGIRLLAREGRDLTSPYADCGRFRLAIYKHAYRAADLVICQSEHMRATLVCQFSLSPTKVIRIYNPVDIDSIKRLAESEPNPFPHAGPNLVAVGRFSHEKGFDLLLQCTSLVRQSLPTAFVTIVGDGPDLPLLRAVRRELGLESCVRLMGLRRNPYPFIKYADLLILPSRSEALPNVVLEAVALGTPVVATNCTRALGEISSCTRHMRIARDATPAGLAAEIIYALGDTKQSNASLEPQFEARFGVRAVTREYERVLSGMYPLP
jgi:glycosyltransferase involved in cell wall biosynthesis